MSPPPGTTPAKAAAQTKKGNARGAPRPSSDEKLRRVGAYTVQCANCFKFRIVPTQEEYEAIRETLAEEPWICSRMADVSCDDPADLEDDAGFFWVIDKPSLPKTPAGCQRVLIMRKDLSKLDATYIMPNGKRMRSTTEVEKFLEAFPEYKSQFSVPNFSFTVPKVIDGMLPGGHQGAGSAGTSKRAKKTEDGDRF